MELTERFCTYNIVTTGYIIREETLGGKKHIVVPVVMMKEGVHHGSHGPIFHSAAELSKYIEAWNGIPVTVHHPRDGGQYVSANTPEMLERYAVGRIFNAHYDEGLRAEAWLDEQRLISVSPDAYEAIRQARPLDVSVGVLSDAERSEGDWQGEHYEAIAHNYRPNHLALLPGEQGACSWSDGCGVRVNKEGGEMKIQTFIDNWIKEQPEHVLRATFDDFIVYEVGSTGTLYRRSFTKGEEPAMAETDERVEITNYVKPDNTGGNSMAEEKKPCCEAKVDALIANEDTRFTAEDREWLLSLEEGAIDKLAPVEQVEVNADEMIATFKQTLKTIDDYTALMPDSMKAEIETGLTMYREKRQALIANIAEKSAFEADELQGMSDEWLEKFEKSINKVADYSGQAAGGGDTKKKSIEPMLPAGVAKPK